MAGRYLGISDLPKTIGVFPLTGILLLPRGELPLNVFEPRYLTLIDAAMTGNRLIGMIQPLEHEEKTLTPKFSAIGCAGRVTSYRETDDGRYLITLKGICRFRVQKELEVSTPYRQVQSDFAAFLGDLVVAEDSDF